MGETRPPEIDSSLAGRGGGMIGRIVHVFLHSNLTLILILLAAAVGVAAVLATPREEEPQIIVPLADVYVSYPGHSAREVELHVATPLEGILSQIDGVEYVYSMSRQDQAIVTVRFYVGEDRERSLVKLRKKIDESPHLLPPGLRPGEATAAGEPGGWVVKPVEIDDVPIVNLAVVSRDANTADELALRRVAEEAVARLAEVKDVSRAYLVGGSPRTARVLLDSERMRGHGVGPVDVQRAIRGANLTAKAGDFQRGDRVIAVNIGTGFADARELNDLVIAVPGGQPVYLKDVAKVVDGPAEITSYVRYGRGPAADFPRPPGAPGTDVGAQGSEAGARGSDLGASARSLQRSGDVGQPGRSGSASVPAVTIALAKKKGANAVRVAEDILKAAEGLRRDLIPDNMQLVVSRNYGLSADEKVNDLIEALAVAMALAVAVLLLGLGWRESIIVALAVPVVFGLTLGVNLLAGFTINRVTLFALILSLGLLVDDPIVDVENVVRHFVLRRKATRAIVQEAVNEIRPPLITATLAVIASFLPLFFITGMMGPYMRPMALNVPVTMLMSLIVALAITPWLCYHVLRRRYRTRKEGELLPGGHGHGANGDAANGATHGFFHRALRPLLVHRWAGVLFLGVVALAFAGAGLMAMTRSVPLKMLPYGNRDEFQLILDAPEGTTLERTDSIVRDFEQFLSTVPEVTGFTSTVGLAGPMDFNGLVRHYYLRQGQHLADIQVNTVGRKGRSDQIHAIALRLRPELEALAALFGVKLKIVEAPPGPPVLATVVAEVYGRPDQSYSELLAASRTVAARLRVEPGVVDVDDMIEAERRKVVFVPDDDKARLSGVTAADIAMTVRTALAGAEAGTIHTPNERNPLRIELRLPREARSSIEDLGSLYVQGPGGEPVPLRELGRWRESNVEQTIYHKNLRPVRYILAEMAGRPPADAVVDIQADRRTAQDPAWPPLEEPARLVMLSNGKDRWCEWVGTSEYFGGWVAERPPRPLGERSFLSSGGGIPWAVPDGIDVGFAGEGEWQLTLDVFRDMGLAFLAAIAIIFILLVAQVRSFVISLVVMLAIPLTVIGIMPGFWLLNALSARQIGPYAYPVFFTATAMIGMIALAGIVTRNAIILVDFIHLGLARGRNLADAIVAACSVRLRPILLTAGVAMLSALPIVADPIFSGLAWSLIFGLLASTLFTLFVVPVTYWLLYAHKPGHGLPVEAEE